MRGDTVLLLQLRDQLGSNQRHRRAARRAVELDKMVFNLRVASGARRKCDSGKTDEQTIREVNNPDEVRAQLSTHLIAPLENIILSAFHTMEGVEKLDDAVFSYCKAGTRGTLAEERTRADKIRRQDMEAHARVMIERQSKRQERCTEDH